MKIEETIQKIENWAQENKLGLLHGIVKGKSVIKVLCDSDSTDILEFLNLGKKNGAKIFIMHKSIFQSENLLDDLEIYDELGEEEEIQIKMLEKYEGNVEFLSIVWLGNNTIFEYFETADWRESIEEKAKVIKLNRVEAGANQNVA